VRRHPPAVDRPLACGGTHLPSTGRSRALRILKIDNKGRHNRRVKYALLDSPA
jgi:misacylated tRNA(Ala) deacylase